MISMAEKLKDIEAHPYMLAIYKDDEQGQLVRHAIDCWKYRARSDRQNQYQSTSRFFNPLIYCAYPPMDLVLEYFAKSGIPFISSKVLQCPKVARWAFEMELDRLFGMAQVSGGFDPYTQRVLNLIEYDDNLIYRIVTHPISSIMPEEFINNLNDEQRATMAICA